MIRNRPAEHRLKLLVFLTLLLVAAFQVAACRGLYADAVSMLVQMLVQRDFLLMDKARVVSNGFTQFPLILALWSGAKNLVFLRYLYSASLLLSPLLFWGLAFAVLRRDFLFWPFVLLFSLVYYLCCFIAVSEVSLCCSLVACCLACLIRRRPLSGGARGILFCAALLLPFDYAATLFFGPLLAVVAGKRLYDERGEGAGRRLYWCALILLFLAATGSGLREVFFPRDPLNFQSARDPAIILHDVTFWLVLGCVLLAGSALLLRPLWYARSAALLSVALGTFLMFQLYPQPPSWSYNIRMYMTLTLLALSVCLIWFRWDGWRRCLTLRKLKTFSPLSHYIAPAFLLFAVLSLLDIENSLGYRDYLTHFQRIVNGASGLLRLEQTPLLIDRGEEEYSWTWTHPSMSLLLRQDSTKAIILNPFWYRDYQPFDARRSVPDLGRYYGER